LITVYLLADVGSVLGGWTSSRLIRGGTAVGKARKLAMLGCALAATPVAFAVYARDIWTAVVLIGFACAAHQGFVANILALPSDLFPRHMAGSVLGMGGLAGAIGGMLMSTYASNVLQTLGSYTPIFVFASIAYLLALLVVQLVVPRYARVEPCIASPQ
jgi:MFS transporter, ACS family, hexuronate transporter